MTEEKEKKSLLKQAMANADGELVKDQGPKIGTTMIPPQIPETSDPFTDEILTEAISNEVGSGVSPAKVIGLKNAGVGVNPKDRIGASKVDMTLIPSTAKVHCALALMDGASKYGPYNWRVEPIQARTYVAAIMRHCEAFLDGEMSASDSGILHMGHVMACAAILLDAEMQGTLTDDRPIVPKPNASASVQLATANNWIKRNKPAGWGR